MYEWLADYGLSEFAPILAKNELDSLRKMSRLTHEEVVEINIELYARQKREDDALVQQHGTRVALGDAIDRLKRDPRTKTIQEQMEGYKDSKVSTVNLLGAQNQVSAFIKKKHWVYLILRRATLTNLRKTHSANLGGISFCVGGATLTNLRKKPSPVCWGMFST